MKVKQAYLKGKSVFIVSLIVIALTILIVYFTGIDYNRTLSANAYLSLGIIAACLFLFMTYGLFSGHGLVNDFKGKKSFELTDSNSYLSGDLPSLPDADIGEGIGGVITSIILWVVMTVLLFILLIVIEAVLWLSLLIISAMLYWVFFRALKMVFSKSTETQGDLGLSAIYSLWYTFLFTGWIFGIIYITEMMR